MGTEERLTAKAVRGRCLPDLRALIEELDIQIKSLRYMVKFGGQGATLADIQRLENVGHSLRVAESQLCQIT